MKTEDTSDCNGLVDLAAVKRVFFQLIDVHRFGDWRIFLDGEDPDEPDSTSYDPEKHRRGSFTARIWRRSATCTSNS